MLNSDMLRLLRLDLDQRPATFGTLSRVFPHEQADDVYSTFSKLRRLFLRFSLGKTQLQGTDFQKKMLANAFIKRNLQSIEVHLAF